MTVPGAAPGEGAAGVGRVTEGKEKPEKGKKMAGLKPAQEGLD